MDPEDLGGEHTWTARTVRPVVLAYVLGLFAVFMIAAHLLFRSPEAVKALGMAAVGSVASLLPTILSQVEYQLTGVGLFKKPRRRKGRGELKRMFRWEELSCFVPTRSGFKYFKSIQEPKKLVRFLKLHFSSDFSGEIHAEDGDREAVLGIIARKKIPILRGGEALESGDRPDVRS
jgi:hypothetical protein